MSSITFPNSPGHLPQLSSSQDHESSFYQNSFDAQSTSSFQMNPLSMHPPRTPRSSLAFSYDSDVTPSMKEDTRPALLNDANGTDMADEDDLNFNPKKAHVSREEIWREVIKSSKGRDKSLKLLQYAMKVYLIFHFGFRRRQSSSADGTSPSWERSLVQRLNSTVSGLSLSRKCLLLFNWLAPLTVIRAQQSVPFSAESATASSPKMRPLVHTLLHTSPPVLIELLNAVADDVYTFSRLGLLGGRIGDRAEKFANWCWFANTLVNLVENSVERGILRELQHNVESRSYTESMTMGATAKSNPVASKIDENELDRLHKRDYWLVMTRNKLLMDLIFVSYDCFGIKRAKAPVQAFTGLAAAVLSSAKLYSNEQNVLAKSIKS